MSGGSGTQQWLARHYLRALVPCRNLILVTSPKGLLHVEVGRRRWLCGRFTTGCDRVTCSTSSGTEVDEQKYSNKRV